MGLGEMASQAWQNIGPSAKQFGQDMSQIVTDPIGTAKGIGKMAVGGVQKFKDMVGIPPMLEVFGDQRASAEAVGKFYADRYGGMENLKNTVATDPVGAGMDLVSALTMGGGLAATAPGIAGRVGAAASKVGSAVDPISLAGKGAGADCAQARNQDADQKIRRRRADAP